MLKATLLMKVEGMLTTQVIEEVKKKRIRSAFTESEVALDKKWTLPMSREKI